MMDEVIPSERAARDFRVKFPDDVMQENLAGQLWFGAEVRKCTGLSVNQMHCGLITKETHIEVNLNAIIILKPNITSFGSH